MNEKKLSPNMQHALDAVRKAHPQPFTTASAPLLKGLAALERRGLVKMVGELIPYQPPSYVLADDRESEEHNRLRTENERLRAALQWVGEVYPGRNSSGGAIVHMTWDEWNALRRALGLREQPIPRRVTVPDEQ